VRAGREVDVAIYAPGLAAGGGAEKTALVTAQTFLMAGLSVACFTDSGVSIERLQSHFGLDLEGIQIRDLPSPNLLPARAPQAIRDLLRDLLHAREVRRYAPRLFINMKFKSELPGVGALNWYYVHFPHRLAQAGRSTTHAAYLRLVAGARRRLLLAGARRFVDSYQLVLANSEFTRTHVAERWSVPATTLYPPCEQTSGASVRDRTKSILSVGRFQADGPQVPHKRHDVLIRAFSELPDLAADGWSLHLVGALGTNAADHRYCEHIERLAQGLSVHVHVNASHELLTHLSAHARVYWHAQGYGTDSSLHPEAQEHFGISTVEAMSAGVVPLVYATAGPAEVVQGEDELMWRTPEELVVRTRAVAEPTRWEHWQAFGIQRAAEFSTDAFRERIRTLYAVHVDQPLPPRGGE
jgi:glycosyltransferase involved in cell wall biosynthesis